MLAGKTVNAKIAVMANAIQSFEGGGPNDRNMRNNNPGNLRPVGFTYAGQTGLDAQGHAIFDSYDSGRAALIHQLSLAIYGGSNVYSPSDTFYDFFSKYAEANQIPYAEFVAAQLGLSPESSIGSLA